MRGEAPGNAGRAGSRAVQIGFVAAFLGLWYLATTRWGVSSILLPNPLNVARELGDILASGEFVADLRVTLTELFVAFAISAVSGVTLRLTAESLCPTRTSRDRAVQVGGRRSKLAAIHLTDPEPNLTTCMHRKGE